MAELRSLPLLTDRETVESVLRVWAAMPWREQVCGLCGHEKHATTLCTHVSEDDPTERCGCGWRKR